MNLARRRIPIISLALAAAVACEQRDVAEPAAGSSVVEQPILGGRLDVDDAFSGVANIEYDGRQHCSGAKVAPGWLLSAGHCLFEMLNRGVSQELVDPDPSAFRIFFGPNADEPSGGYAVEAVFVHPAFDPWGTTGFGHDLSLWRFTDDDTHPSYCWRGDPDVGGPVDYRELKAEVAAVGYGLVGLEPSAISGRRHALRASLDWICRDPAGCHIGLGQDWTPPSSLGLIDVAPPEGPHYGDSGGPLFLYRPVDTPGHCQSPAVIAGVYSHRTFGWGFVDEGCDPVNNPIACHSQVIAYTDVASHADWIGECVQRGSCTGQVVP